MEKVRTKFRENYVFFWDGADRGTRTPDPQFTKLPLYQLSYVGLKEAYRRAISEQEARSQLAFSSLQDSPAIENIRRAGWGERELRRVRRSLVPGSACQGSQRRDSGRCGQRPLRILRLLAH